jgi:hypothetical protein
MAATTQVKVTAAFRASVPLGSAGVGAGCIAPTAQPTGTLIRLFEAVSATCLNESSRHPRYTDPAKSKKKSVAKEEEGILGGPIRGGGCKL